METTTVPARRALLFSLYVANTISATGDSLMLLAIPWFVLQTTGSIAQTGLTAFVEASAVTLSALLGSAAVDRIGLRRAAIISDLASAVGVFLIPLLYGLGMLPFWGFLALVFLAGMVSTPGSTARGALIPDLAALAQARMERVTSLVDGLSRVSRFLGAPLAAVLIGVMGTSNLLYIDALSFAISGALIWAAIPHNITHTSPAEAKDAAGSRSGVRGYLGDIRAGAVFIRRDSVLLSIIATVMVTNLLDGGMGSVLAPAYIKQLFGSPVVLGAMFAAFGGAAFLGTLVFGAIGHRLPRRLTLATSFTIVGGPRYFTLALIPLAPVLVVAHAIAGFCVGPINPLIDTVAFERIPTQLRARVFGVVTAGAMMGTPLGALLSGWLGSQVGPRPALLAFGAVYLVATLSLFVNPALRQMERKPAAAAPETLPAAS